MTPDTTDSPDRMTRRTALLAGAAGLSMVGLSGCVSISRDSRRRTEVVHEDSSELAGLSIQTTDGDVVLKDATDDQVTIRAVKRARGDVAFEDLALETSRDSDHLSCGSACSCGTIPSVTAS